MTFSFINIILLITKLIIKFTAILIKLKYNQFTKVIITK